MTGVLTGIEVLDLSWGIPGPMASMLLADHGARVTRIEAPQGDPFEELSGYRVWNRGKRRAVLDLKDDGDRTRLLKLAARADVLIESFSVGVTARLGIDYETLRAINPRLVYCSISAYGQSGADVDRPGLDALVAARTGHDFEGRGVVGGMIGRLSGTDGVLPGLEAPPGMMNGRDSAGPLFSGLPWISLAAFYLANLGINAALRAREKTGRGQWVQTSLLQGVLSTTIAGWQRVEHPDAENFQSWVIDPRAPKGFFQGSDGQWMHHWVPLPAFVLGAAAADELSASGGVAPKDAPLRIGVNAEDMIILHHYQPLLAEAVGKFPTEDWVRVAAEVGVPVQAVRSPEAALLDPLFVEDGCVVEVDDPEVGPIRMVGSTVRLSAFPPVPPAPTVPRGTHTAEVVAEADALPAPVPETAAAGHSLDHPLAGIKVLDLGLAVAGPWGTQMLADLGAEVIKVSAAYDGYWMSNHIAMSCNRSKRSIAIDLKNPEGLAILHELVAGADIVQHNMRYAAAQRLGVDYESLKAIKPDLIYCHTRGFEHGVRDSMPGNDQMGAALAGTSWLDGGLDHGGHPLWSMTSLGDTGNGYLSAIGMIQALIHRDRTGEGQFVDTSIVYAQLLNASSAWVTPDGARRGDRHQLDAELTGMSAQYRLYETADDRWLAVAALELDEFQALCETVGRPDLGSVERYAPAGNAGPFDADTTAGLRAAFKQRGAEEWSKLLADAGVPCEIADPDYAMSVFDDPELIEKGWVTSYRHPQVGRMDVFGELIDFSETPGKIWGPPFVPGEHTVEILGELGRTPEEIAALLSAGIVHEPAR